MYYVIWILLVSLCFYMLRVIKGPSVWDRLQCLSLISTKILLIIVLFASIMDLTYILDIAIVYALLGFIGTVFTAQFLLKRLKGEKD